MNKIIDAADATWKTSEDMDMVIHSVIVGNEVFSRGTRYEIAREVYQEYWFTEETIQADGSLRPTILFTTWLDKQEQA